MIAALLVLLLALWITWVLFRDDNSAEKIASPVGSQEHNERDRQPRAEE